ncbi:hypothetical protein [Aquimarina algiphila]|uniref:Uncharacterized protein n=1 Tax=Aquimarina algiphila TaxID=2047982 RepID=A0A554VBA4_9FLAO|nr:hypothetical protein [Aquimarina algiphila]TSE03797.1 hypothetical protein FOF46_28415 [Aquimarina algiphila]
MFATNIISSAGEKLAYELIGHGLSFFNQGVGSQHVNSIQASNLYKRVTSGGSYRFYRNGLHTVIELQYQVLYLGKCLYT